MPRDHSVHDLCPQFLGCEPGVDVTHRWGYLERAIPMSFDGVAAPAVFLQYCLTSSL
jgi:hypothetical protein